MRNAEYNKKRVVKYLAWTFILAYLVQAGVWLLYKNGQSKIGQAVMAAMMFIPALGVLLSGGKFSGMGWRPQFRKNWKSILTAWFGPALLAAAGAALYFLIFPAQFDWNMTYYMESLAKTGTIVELSPLRTTILSQMITAVILGPVMNCITCFGEEWGWRGYLLPKLLKAMPVIPAILVSGVIWGIWHITTIIAGLNYGTEYNGYPYGGILMMILFCIVIGIFFSFLTIRTGSCIPAIIGHGAVNSIAASGVYFTTDGGKLLLGPPVTGVIGMVPFMITAVILIALLVRNNACAIETTCDTIVEVSSE